MRRILTMAVLSVLLVAGGALGAQISGTELPFERAPAEGWELTEDHEAGVYALRHTWTSARVDFQLGSAFEGTLYVCNTSDADADGDDSVDAAAGCQTVLSLSADAESTVSTGKRWYVLDIDTAETSGNTSRLTIRGSNEQVSILEGGGSAAMFEFCRGGGKGVGWDSVTRTYAATCAFYPWSAEIGGFDATDPLETGFHSTPTTAGGNQVETECDGVYDPIPECLADGEVVVKGAMADAILAHEMTRQGGKIYGHMKEGYRFTGWEVALCGEGNSCPRLRPPFNNLKANSFGVWGNRQFILEGNDLDQFDGIRSGAALLVNSGAEPNGQDPSADKGNVPRRQNRVGMESSVMNCVSWPCAPTDQTGIPSAGESLVSKSATVPGTQTDPDAFCVEDALASTGTCHDPSPAVGEELWSHRYACTTDGDCTGLDASTSAWTCTGFASTIRETIALTGHPFPVAANVDRGAGIGLSSARFPVQSVSGTACETTGLEVDIRGAWPFIEEEVGATTSTDVDLRAASGLVNQTQPAYFNVQSLPASSRQYGIKAAQVPNGSQWTTGEVAIITDDTNAGDCTDAGADGQLDGGGSAVSECAWNGSAWVTADCEANTADPDTNSAAGCEDEATAFALQVAEGEGMDGVSVSHFSHPEANPILDGQPIAGTRIAIRNSMFANNYGRISDTGHWEYLHNLFEGNDGGDNILLSLGFLPYQTFCYNRLIHNETETGNNPLISIGEGELVLICDNEFVGNDPSSSMFFISRLRNVTFRDNRGIGNDGPIYRIYNEDDETDFGTLRILGDTWEAHEALSPVVNVDASNGELPAAVMVAGVFAAAGHGGEFVGPYIIDGLTVRTKGDGALVFIEDGGNVSGSSMRSSAEHFDIRDSYIDSLDGGSVMVIARGAQTAGSGLAFANFKNVFSDNHMPRWHGNYANGVKFPDWEYATIDSANGPECELSLSAATAKTEVIPGTRQAINDANAAAATDACDNDQDGILLGADGVGDAATGTDMRVCECQDVGSNPVWTAVYP